MKISRKQLEDLIFEELKKEGLQDFIPQGFEKFRVANKTQTKIPTGGTGSRPISDKLLSIIADFIQMFGDKVREKLISTTFITKLMPPAAAPSELPSGSSEEPPADTVKEVLFENYSSVQILDMIKKKMKSSNAEEKITSDDVYNFIIAAAAIPELQKGLVQLGLGDELKKLGVTLPAPQGSAKPEASDTDASTETGAQQPPADGEQEVEPSQILSQAPAIQLQSKPGKIFQANLIKLAGNDKTKKTQIARIFKALVSDLQKAGVNNLEEAKRQEVALIDVIKILNSVEDQTFRTAIKNELVQFLRFSRIKLGAAASRSLQGGQNTSATSEQPVEPAAGQQSSTQQSAAQTQDQKPADTGQSQAQPEQLPQPPPTSTLVFNPEDPKILERLRAINKETGSKISETQLKVVIAYLVANGLLYYNNDKIQEKRTKKQRKEPLGKNATKRQQKKATARPIWQYVLKQPAETIVKDQRFIAFVKLIAMKIQSKFQTLLPFMTGLLKTGKLGMPNLPKVPGEQDSDSQEQDFGPPEQNMGLPERIPLEEKRRWQKLAGILKD